MKQRLLARKAQEKEEKERALVAEEIKKKEQEMVIQMIPLHMIQSIDSSFASGAVVDEGTLVGTAQSSEKRRNDASPS